MNNFWTKFIELLCILVVLLAGIVIGCIVSAFISVSEKDDNYTIEAQHYMMMRDNTYQYCPYCGEKLGESK